MQMEFIRYVLQIQNYIMDDSFRAHKEVATSLSTSSHYDTSQAIFRNSTCDSPGSNSGPWCGRHELYHYTTASLIILIGYSWLSKRERDIERRREN